MNKKIYAILILFVVSILLISGILFITESYAGGATTDDVTAGFDSLNTNNENDRDNDYTYIPPTDEGDATTPTDPAEPTKTPFVPATEMDLDPSSITVFVNKEYALPKDYKPSELVTPNIYFNLISYDERTQMRPEASEAIELLFQAAEKDGYLLSGVSGYRSYSRQKKIFTNNIVTKGKTHTLKYSAVPGTSEHQTGLAMDISCKSLRYNLLSTFAETPEGKWVADNAHRFGYIIRYAKGKADITGYAYEPWHIRYVGKDLATYLYENDLTLEEYYKYEPSADFDFEALYADLINYKPVVTVIPPKGDGVIVGENGEIIEGEIEDGEEPTEGEEVTPSTTPKPTKPPASITPTAKPTPKPSISPTVPPIISPTVIPTIPPEDTDNENPDNPGDTTTDPETEPDGSTSGMTPTPTPTPYAGY